MPKFLFILFLLPLSLFARDIPLDPDTPLVLSLSHNTPTRIAFDNQRIVDLFVYPKEGANVFLHPSGFLMVLPASGSPLFLTLIGENGTIQDLQLDFTDQQPALIRLCTLTKE